MKERVMYLDIDDTLLVWTDGGFAAPKADEFMKWALEHFEVRWMTMWTPSGKLREAGARELEYRFGGTIPAKTFLDIYNPKGFGHNKMEALDTEDTRPWVWVEDNLYGWDNRELIMRGYMNNFYPTHVTNNVVALQVTWMKLAKRFDLPKPKYPYSKKVIKPQIILSDKELLAEYRNNKMQNHDAARPAEQGLW